MSCRLRWTRMTGRSYRCKQPGPSDQVMYHVMDEVVPRKIWEKLESRFLSKTATTKVYLKQKFYKLKMQEGSDLVEHMNTYNHVVTDLAHIGVKIDDEDKAILFLC